MPELPEVEVVARGLRRALVGAVLEEISVDAPHSVVIDGRRQADAPPAAVERALRDTLGGRQLASVERRGKLLALRFGPAALLVHLRMTGQLIVGSRPAPSAADDPGCGSHTRFRLGFRDDDASVLRWVVFNDVRRFGYARLVVDEGELGAVLARLGPDALEEEAVAALRRAAARRRAAIKALLLDQSVVAGVGNAYADEALHRAGIAPWRPANDLGAREIERLARAVRQVLVEGIACGGLTVRDYRGPDGRAGTFRECLRVYGRSGERCGRCGSRIERARVGGRTAHYCPRCQQ